MSDSNFIEPTLEISNSWGESLEVRNQADQSSNRSTVLGESPVNYEGYAEFVSHMAHLQVPTFTDKFLLSATNTVANLGQGGTFVVRTAKLTNALHTARKSNPFILKASREAMVLGRPVESQCVEAGTNVVTKHVDFRSLKHRRAQGPVPASKFLRPFQTEATVLSHPYIRKHPFFPSLLGIGVETSPDDVGDTPQLYPFFIMELGLQGSLDQSFRELWYSILEQMPGLPNSNNVFRKITIPWEYKLSLARKVGCALNILHSHGVVHGDVKLQNTLALMRDTGKVQIKSLDSTLFVEHVMSDEQMLQLADFGSSVFLSEIPIGGKARLKSHSPPWNAPESNTEILRDDLVKTDIYSYGLLFARIILLGASPLDSEFDAYKIFGYGSSSSERDSAILQKLRDDDKVHEHVHKQIRATGLYSEDQLRVVGLILQKTLRTHPGDRVQSLDPINLALDLVEEYPINLALAMIEEYGILHPSVLSEVQTDLDDSFIEPSPSSIDDPCVLKHTFGDFGSNRILMREVVQDLRHQIMQKAPEDENMAQLHYHLALCYFNAWGTPRIDWHQGLDNLNKALHLGSKDALWLLPVAPSSVSDKLQLDEVMLDNFSDQPEMCKAVQLQRIFSDKFGMALDKARNTYMEYSDGKRRKIDDGLPISNRKELCRALYEGTMKYEYYGNEKQDHAKKSDLFVYALCLAAAEGNLDAVLDLVDQTIARLGISTREYLNRCTESCEFDIGYMKVDESSEQSVTNRQDSKPDLTVKLEFEAKSRPLMMACANGHFEVASFLLTQGADSSLVDASGRCPLHYLARFDPDEVEQMGELLLQDHPDVLVDQVDNDGISPLAFVLDADKNWVPGSGVAAAKFLLGRGASWYDKANPSRISMSSPLVRAVQSWDLAAMKLIKQYAQNRSAKTVHKERVQERNEGQKKDAAAGDQESKSPANACQMNRCSGSGCCNIFEEAVFHAQILLAIRALALQPPILHHLKGETYGLTLETMIQFLIGSAPAKFPASSFVPAMHEVVEMGAVRVAEVLTATLPSFDWSSQQARFMVASMELISRNFTQMIVTLAELGYNIGQTFSTDPQIDDDSVPKGKVTFLHLAAIHRAPIDIIERISHILPAQDKQSLEQDSLSCTTFLNAFDMAVIHGHFELANHLLTRGADFNSPHIAHSLSQRIEVDLSSNINPPVTLLGYLLASVMPEALGTPRRGDLLRYLLKLNPECLVCPSLKQNVFHLVWRPWAYIGKDYFNPENEPKDVFQEVMALFEHLRAHFTDASLLAARDVNGATPLHLAARSGNIAAVQRLMQLGVDANVEDNKGYSPLDYAYLAILQVVWYTVSGDAIPDPISLDELGQMLSNIDCARLNLSANHCRGRESPREQVGRSVELRRILKILQERQAGSASSQTTLCTRREEPTELMALLEVMLFLYLNSESEKFPGSRYEEDDIYSAD